MKVFIGWSGDASKAVAQAVREWLPCVIQAIKPWMSKHDISSGSRWAVELAKELSDTRVSLICLTPDNLSAPWLLFEAGACSKTLDGNTLVCTYLVGLKPTDVSEPLGQFQATIADKEGTHKLLKDINEKLEERLAEEYLETAFEALWPKLQKRLETAANLKPAAKRPREERDLLEEILNNVRQLARADSERRQPVELGAFKVTYDAASAAVEGETKGDAPTSPLPLPPEIYGGGPPPRRNRLYAPEFGSPRTSTGRSTGPDPDYKSEPIPKREK
jgi:hypothetical protein